jgi:hypothetical protein
MTTQSIKNGLFLKKFKKAARAPVNTALYFHLFRLPADFAKPLPV